MSRLIRVADGAGVALTGVVEGAEVVLHRAPLLDVLGGSSRPTGARARIVDARTLSLESPYRLLRPLDPPEVWAAGVTYERSRRARREETEVADVYSLVYDAERPEIFLKDACCRRTVGPDEPIAVRSDSVWTVPEPELALVLGERGEIVAFTAGNDVTARDIEAVNPLYLPQAKTFAGCCALGPAVVPFAARLRPRRIGLEIRGPDGTVRFSGSTSTGSLRRAPEELAAYACRDNPIPPGSVLLTGTGIVPPDEVALEDGDVVEVEVEGVGTLRNPVQRPYRFRHAERRNVIRKGRE